MTAREFKMPFGKYRGETLEEIYMENVGYLEWFRDEMCCNGDPSSKALVDKIVDCFKEMRNVKICK